jgi:hypothetical protein
VQTEHETYKCSCPECDSEDLKLIDLLVDEEENTYKNDKFYGVGNRLKKMYEWDEYVSMRC